MLPPGRGLTPQARRPTAQALAPGGWEAELSGAGARSRFGLCPGSKY